MNSIIHYLLVQNQYLLQTILFLFKFICKFIPLRQFAFDNSHSPEYQKFKIDKPPHIIYFGQKTVAHIQSQQANA